MEKPQEFRFRFCFRIRMRRLASNLSRGLKTPINNDQDVGSSSLSLS